MEGANKETRRSYTQRRIGEEGRRERRGKVEEVMKIWAYSLKMGILNQKKWG